MAGTEEGKRLFEQTKGKFSPGSPLNMSDLFPILRWFDYKGVEKGMKLLHNKRDDFLQSLIEEFRKKKVNSYGGRKFTLNLVGTLLGLQESDPDFYTDDIVKSMILVLFVGGTETSSMTINQIILLLVSHTHVYQKVKAEVDNQIGNKRFLE